MLGIFTAPATDKSLQYLSQIFGTMNGVISSPGIGNSTASLTLLGTMFNTFNSIVLTIGALVVVYVTVVGVIMTAQEGEFMGKKYGNIWLPIRTVMGVAALVPTGSGYSGLQIIMMWVIVQGVGAADTLWNTVLGYVSVMGSPYAQAPIPAGKVNLGMQDLFKGLVCAKSAAQTYDNPGGMAPLSSTPVYTSLNYYCNVNPKVHFCQSDPTRFSPTLSNGNTYGMGPDAACGTLKFCDLSSISDTTSIKYISCQAQIKALKDIIPTLASIADKFVQVDYEYLKYYNNKDGSVRAPLWVQQYCTDNKQGPECYRDRNNTYLNDRLNPDASPMNTASLDVTKAYYKYALKDQLGDGDFIATSVSYFTSQISLALQDYIKTMGSSPTSVRSDLADAQTDGWIMAGGYYYALTRQNSQNLKDAMPEFEVDIDNSNLPSTSLAAAPNPANIMISYRNNFSAAGNLIKLAAGQNPTQPSNEGMASANQAAADAFASALNVTDTGSNPLTQIAVAGYAMLLAVQIAFVIFLILMLVFGLTSKINILVLGTGLTDNPMSNMAMMMYMVFIPLFFMMLGLMITYGGMLAVYIPLLPFVIFTAGAIGWLTSCIEAMVAGPLVALGILSPSSQGHEMLGKADHAIMLLFNIFLRPGLMIFGLVASMLLASVVVSMINAGFANAVLGIGSMWIGGSSDKAATIAALATNPVGLVLILAAYVGLLVSSLNKCFAAIHIIPENVMRWIGGQKGESYGESEMTGEVKGKTEGAAAGAKQFGSETHGRAKGAHERKLKDKETFGDDKKKQMNVSDTGKGKGEE